MKIKLTNHLKSETLITLKNGYFIVSNQSRICEIFNISIKAYDVFKINKKRLLDRNSKIELLQWVKEGFIQTDNSLFAKTVTPPTFLEIMKKASIVD